MTNSLWSLVFLSVFFVTTITCSFMEGRVAESARIDQQREGEIEQQIAKTHYWQGKYESLASETDGITVLAAEAKYQRSGQ